MSMKACTHDGRPLRFFTIMDEHTRECLAIDVERKMNHQHVLARLADLFIMHEVPGYIRSNKGNEFTAKVETLCVIPLRSGNLERLSFCGCGNTAMILIWIPDQVGNDSIIANRVGNERSRLNLLFQQLVLFGCLCLLRLFVRGELRSYIPLLPRNHSPILETCRLQIKNVGSR